MDDEENWTLTTERIAQVLADVRKTPCPRSACCMDDVDRVRFALHIIAEKALAELLVHRAAQTASVERVREVVREAVMDTQGEWRYHGHPVESAAIAIATRIAAQLTEPARRTSTRTSPRSGHS